MSVLLTPWSRERHNVENPDDKSSLPEFCDVCVIGAGIAGLTAAYHLAKAGRSVVVLESGVIGGGETARSSAHLSYALDDRYRVIERLHGQQGSRLAAESHASAINFVEMMVNENSIPCDFARINGYLISATHDRKALAFESGAADRAGVSNALVSEIPGVGEWSGAALQFPRQARINPCAYIVGLAACVLASGGKIYHNCRVSKVEDGQLASVTTEGGLMIKATDVVVATNVPINDRIVLQTKLEAYRSYIVAFSIEPGTFPDVLLWDDADPYHYLRLVHEDSRDLLLVGGADHKTGQGPSESNLPYDSLETWARERFPSLGPIVCAWSGQIIEPLDGLAYIGLNPGDEHVYIVTGDSGNGLTHGTLGGKLIGDLILGLSNPWAELYRPGRLSLRTAFDYAEINANALAQYSDWLGLIVSTSDLNITAGSGTVVRNGVHPVAVHRSVDGVIHRCSAVCPHLGGVVRWNDIEKTWDCPCHGSRFSPDGAVLNGPANSGLSPIAEV